jgi:mRNA-degrading endonuclease toxin of MazEF toxin-antitoxin module
LKQYEIWWASLPQPAGRRPVLLLSRDAAYEYLNKFIAVEVTTTIRHIAMEVPLGKAEGLSKPCVVNCDNIRTITRSALVKRIGQLGPAKRDAAKRALGHSLGWYELISV